MIHKEAFGPLYENELLFRTTWSEVHEESSLAGF